MKDRTFRRLEGLESLHHHPHAFPPLVWLDTGDSTPPEGWEDAPNRVHIVHEIVDPEPVEGFRND